MHSSRMHTGRSLSVSGGVPGLGGCTWSRGVYMVWGGVPGLGVVYLVWGVYLVGGCTWSRGFTWSGGGVPGPGGCLQGTPPGSRPGTPTPAPVDRITDACKNITLAKTSFRPVISEFPTTAMPERELTTRPIAYPRLR